MYTYLMSKIVFMEEERNTCTIQKSGSKKCLDTEKVVENQQ
jgi:hypothetical protein